MKIKTHIKLTQQDKEFLEEYKKKPRTDRQMKRVNILTLLDKQKDEQEVADFLGVALRTIYYTKKKFQTLGVEGSLKEKPRPGQPLKRTIEDEAELIAIACTDPPEGRTRWTLDLLSKEVKKRKKQICRTQIHVVLKKTILNHGKLSPGVYKKLLQNIGKECMIS